MPLFKKVKRVLAEVDPLNSKVEFVINKEAINQFYPSLVVDRDVELQYRLDEPHFYRSVIKEKNEYFFIFGYIVSIFLVLHYLFKILVSVPQTQNQGEIIPHILLLTAPAIVFYPSLSEYLNYCAGFTLLDFPWLNGVFAESLTDTSDTAPPGFLTFYTNVNLASTYLLAFCIFAMISTVLLGVKVGFE